jgi:hypothetical protein
MFVFLTKMRHCFRAIGKRIAVRWILFASLLFPEQAQRKPDYYVINGLPVEPDLDTGTTTFGWGIG